MKKMLLALPMTFLLLSACGNENTSPKGTDTTGGEGYKQENYNQNEGENSNETPSPSPASSLQTALPEAGEEVAVISTELGDITVRFFRNEAPKAVQNFITHAKDGYYDNLIFHRVIDGFMIQGGDPEGTGRGGESIWQKPFEDEFSPNLSNIRGAVSMANAGPNTNGSQFFINQINNTYLDGHHTVFGQVISGMDILDKIAKVEKGPNDKPVEDVKMTVKIISYGEDQE